MLTRRRLRCTIVCYGERSVGILLREIGKIPESDFRLTIVASVVTWLIVWFGSIAMVAHEKTDHFLTLLLSSLGAPAFLLGLMNLFAR